jgi:fatty acid desaturase
MSMIDVHSPAGDVMPESAPVRAPAGDIVDVPGPTDNGRLPPEAVARIRDSSTRLPLCLLVAMTAWVGYLLLVPLLWSRIGATAAFLVPTLGVTLFAWLGYYRHELWHNYFPAIHNPTWFNVVSYMLFSDPQVYRVAHPSHHKYVHTPRDIEFFCERWEDDPARRRRQFVLELLFGNMAWELATLRRLKKEGRATARAGRIAAMPRFAILGAIVGASSWLQPGSGWACFWIYWLSVWAGSVMTRHNQWIEHLGIVSDGSLAERNLLTRNLRSDTFAGWLFNLMNHDDAREHVFHHTEPQLNSRGIDGLALPPGARTCTVGEYLSLLVRHCRTP